MNLKNSKANEVSHIRRIISREHSALKGICSYPLSHLYFFTVTPKGESKVFDDYLKEFQEMIYLMKPLNFAYYVKEIENTDHLHGVISIKVPDYKFKKMISDSFIFRATPMISLTASCLYMDKHHPTHLYMLRVIKFHTRIMYDGRGGNPKGYGLQRKNVMNEIKLCLPIA